jgi:hypothetical protein
MISYEYDITGQLHKISGVYTTDEVDIPKINAEVFYRLNDVDQIACQRITLAFQSTQDPTARRTLIARYLFILHSYLTVDVTCLLSRISEEELCSSCGHDIKNNSKTCGNCGLLLRDVIFDHEEGGDYSSSSYNERDNFSRTLSNFQGMTDIPKKDMADIIEKLDKYFRGRDVEKTRVTMREALKRIGFKQYYDFCPIIMNVYWRDDLPDLRFLQSKIMELYDSTQIAFRRIREKEKVSALNNQFRLYAILTHLGHECSRDEFALPKLGSTWRRNVELWKRMLEMSGHDVDSVDVL